MQRGSVPKAAPKYFDTYAFHLGDFHLACVLDGVLTADCATILNGPPTQQLAGLLRSQGLGLNSAIQIPWTMLFIDTGKNKVMVDTGMSKTYVDMEPVLPDEKSRRVFISGHPVDCGHLLENLRYLDIKAAEIDTVIITHAHPDHIGGLVNPGSGKPAFPNARVFMWREEWEFYMENPDALTRLNKLARGPVPETIQLEYARQCLAPIRDQCYLGGQRADRYCAWYQVHQRPWPLIHDGCCDHVGAREADRYRGHRRSHRPTRTAGMAVHE